MVDGMTGVIRGVLMFRVSGRPLERVGMKSLGKELTLKLRPGSRRVSNVGILRGSSSSKEKS